MSKPLYRANSSGGVNRLDGSYGGTLRTGFSQTGSAGPENRALREQLKYLQHQLLSSRAETEKVTDQLNCLISLIKRAWAGDQTANVHVANIVGAAPPDLITKTSNIVNNVSFVTKPKSGAVNHWAVLTIGLLNREYRRMEKALEARQLCHLQRRQEFLDDQLVFYKDEALQLHRRTPAARSPVNSARGHCPTTDHNGVVGESNLQPPPGQRSAPQERHCTSPVEGLSSQVPHEPIGRHHYGWQNVGTPDKISVNKPPSAGSHRQTLPKHRRGSKPESDLTWADLVIQPANPPGMNKATSRTMDSLYHLPSQPVDADRAPGGRQEEFDEDRLHLAYDNPHRYAQNGLFNVEEALGSDVVCHNKRPLSGKMKQSDSLRARPKSAVSNKQERPLKYETTRPLSAPKSKSQHQLNNTTTTKPPNRAQSAKQRESSMRKTSCEKNSLHSTGPTARGKSAPAGVDRQAALAREAGRQAEEAARRKARLLLEDPQLASLINVDVTQPECIKEFDDELQEMADKERDFKLRAIELQKKLGITSEGILYPDL